MAKKEELESVLSDVHTLDSKIGLIAQRIRTIEQNEEVIGRTLIALNNRLKALEERTARGTVSKAEPADASDLEKRFATKQDIKEIRYTLDMVNPLQFATIAQVRELVNEKIAKIERNASSSRESSEKKGSASALMEKM